MQNWRIIGNTVVTSLNFSDFYVYLNTSMKGWMGIGVEIWIVEIGDFSIVAKFDQREYVVFWQ